MNLLWDKSGNYGDVKLYFLRLRPYYLSLGHLKTKTALRSISLIVT